MPANSACRPGSPCSWRWGQEVVWQTRHLLPGQQSVPGPHPGILVPPSSLWSTGTPLLLEGVSRCCRGLLTVSGAYFLGDWPSKWSFGSVGSIDKMEVDPLSNPNSRASKSSCHVPNGDSVLSELVDSILVSCSWVVTTVCKILQVYRWEVLEKQPDFFSLSQRTKMAAGFPLFWSCLPKGKTTFHQFFHFVFSMPKGFSGV